MSGENLTNQQAAEISMDIFATPASRIERAFNLFLNHSNPRIQFAIGTQYFADGEAGTAHKHYLRGALTGINNRSIYKDSPFVGALGMCYSSLLLNYRFEPEARLVRRIVPLAYYYLSRNAFDRKKGDLLLDWGNAFVHRSLMFTDSVLNHPVLPFGVKDLTILDATFSSPEIFAAHDLFKSYEIDDNIPALNKAKEIYNDADVDLSFEEYVKEGNSRHIKVFRKVQEMYMNGEYDITETELKKIFNTTAVR